MPKPIRMPNRKPEARPSAEKIQEQIRQKAYELYEQRGRKDGHELDDWLKAESEVARRAKVTAA